MRLLDLLVFTNIYVAAGAASLTLATRWASGFDAGLDAMVGLVFSATLFAYGLDRVAQASPEDAGSQDTPRLEWLSRRQLVVFGLMGLGGFGALGCAAMLPAQVLKVLGVLGAVTVAYSVPLGYWRGRFIRLKEIPGAKVFLIASVWGTATASLPLMAEGVDVSSPRMLCAWAERTLFIFAIAVPFDVRDAQRDRAAGIVTLPHVLGTHGTSVVARAALAMHVVFAVMAYGPYSMSWAGMIAVDLGAGVMLSGLRGGRSEAYYTHGLDGTMLAQSAAVGALWALGG